MTYLLDVNVLIALIDPAHVNHDAAHDWFALEGRQNWATCPVTENGLIRIVGNPKYPNSTGSPAAAIPLLVALTALPGHVFWPDDICARSSTFLDSQKLLTSGQVTDSCLLALAASKNGKLATLDRRLSVDAVKQGRKHLTVI